jgi:hypothetical protein
LPSALVYAKGVGVMSDPTPSTDPNALLFPAFLHGDHATCRRKWKAEAKKWGKRYQERSDFLEPKLIPVQPGSVIWTNDAAADMLMLGAHERRSNPNWHFYYLRFLEPEASPGGSTRALFYQDYEAFLCRYPWGALSLTIYYPMHTSISLVSQRLEAVLSFWEQLDTVRYFDLSLKEVELAALLYFWNVDIMLTWVDAPVGRPIRHVLRDTMERMRNASEDEIHARMMRRLYQLIDTDPELKHREWLKTPGLIEAELAHTQKTNPDWYEDLTTGRSTSGLLTVLERKYPGD